MFKINDYVLYDKMNKNSHLFIYPVICDKHSTEQLIGQQNTRTHAHERRTASDLTR